MLRRLLLAVLFCVAAWVMTDRTSAGSDPAAATTASIGVTAAPLPIDTHPPEARWEALLPVGIGAGSSSRSQHHQPHARAVDLPDAFSRVPWPATLRVSADAHGLRFRSAHLLHTPLLI